ncbi:MAG: T9SS type A sorting domain-containing protein [Bacteroidota bacterium]
MKKMPVIIIMLLLTVLYANGQPYASLFGNVKTSWNVAYFLNSETTITDSLVACNDTMMNGYTYKYIRDYGYMNLDGFLREDTATGRAWFLDKSAQPREYLIMDLSLNVGDTFIIPHCYYPADSVCIVDSVVYAGGKKIVYLSSSAVLYNDGVLAFIEGIGPNTGINFQQFQASAYHPPASLLLCAYKDGVQSYANTNPIFSSYCFVDWIGISENRKEASDLRIYPNPSDYKIVAEFSGAMPYSIEIFNSVGRRITFVKDIRLSPFEINLSDYSQGMYLLKTTDGKGKSEGVKILHL